jgi:polyisoprenoid-binding protein YceI
MQRAGRSNAGRFHRAGIALIAVLLCVWAVPALAQGTAAAQSSTQIRVTLDPARTKVEFMLGATAHTVHGTFKLTRGEIHFDPESGKASGEIVVDARSGDTDSSGRDKKMHEEVLESAKYSEIVFMASRVRGTVAPQGTSRVQVTGSFRLQGQEHEMTLAFTVVASASDESELDIETHFSVPYVAWGLKNPSSFLLHVDKAVDVTVHATGEMSRSPTTGH